MTECYKVGQFIDAAGKVRKFVACGILRETKDELVLANVHQRVGLLGFSRMVVPVEEFDGDGHIRSGIFLGVSVCSNLDEFDLETGKKIAIGRALNGRRPQKWIHTDFPEILNEAVLSMVTEQFAKLITENPEKYAPGFYRTEAVETYNSLSDQEKLIVKALQMGEVDMEKLVNLAGQLKTLPAQSMQSCASTCTCRNRR